MKRVVFDPDAREEFNAAIDWYERHVSGLGARFLLAVEAAISSIRERPLAWSHVPAVPRRVGARRKLVHEFPYAVVCIILDAEIHVLAIAHGRRRPGYWRRRPIRRR